MEELSRVMEDLKMRDNSERTVQCLDKILTILDDEEHDHDTTTKFLLEQDVLTELFHVLKTTINTAKISQVIAELAKTEEAREPCVSKGFIPPLLALLSLDNIPVCIQASRALGNICFDNDLARTAIADNNGIRLIIDLLKDAANLTVEDASRLRMVSCGLLLNLSNTHETVQEKALGQGAMEIMQQYLQIHAGDESVVQMALLSVGSLADADVGKAKLLETSILETIVQLIGTDVGDNLLDTILELLTNLSESDAVKVHLAKTDLGNRVLDLLERSKQGPEEDLIQMEKIVSDLLVLLLTGDGSMEVLYGEGEGRVFLESLTWLQSPREQLYVSGALAIGNFARNDSQCIQLMEKGVTEKLFILLTRETNAVNSLPTLQHAVFSALRNLAIPAANKSRMVESGLIEKTLQCIKTEFSSVQFKLLGTLRMAIDGQEAAAKQLGTHDEFLDKLVSWCTVEEHAGVKGEANRLVAALIKHSRSSEAMSSIVKHGGIPHLVSMATSEHTVMQNEALFALTLIATSVLDISTESLTKAELVPTIKVLLTDEDTRPEIHCNVLTLVTACAKSGELLQLMKLAGLPNIVKKMQKHEESMVSQQAKEVAAILNKG